MKVTDWRIAGNPMEISGESIGDFSGDSIGGRFY